MAFHLTWIFGFGLLGNVISFLVYLAPLPTFYQIYKKKSTRGFQSIPYVVALFSSMLWICYAMLKKDANLLITINSVGCVIEFIYIMLFLFYANKNARILTMKLLLLLNIFGFGLMLLLTFYLSKGEKRVHILGWICLVFNIICCSFMHHGEKLRRQVIETKSVEYMPFPLSFFLTLGAVTWFFYGLFLKDYYIALPNTLGFFIGVVQMLIYAFYRNTKKVLEEPKLRAAEHISVAVKLSTSVIPLSTSKGSEVVEDQIENEKAQETKIDMDGSSAA